MHAHPTDNQDSLRVAYWAGNLPLCNMYDLPTTEIHSWMRVQHAHAIPLR